MTGLRIVGSLVGAVAAVLAITSTAFAAQGCPNGFRCLDVTVPLDRSGAVPGTLDLPVAVQEGDGPVLLALGGGPGQGMIGQPFTLQFAEVLPVLAPGYRIAFLDQRGTGGRRFTARRCSAPP